jgi:hypothetical protein
VKSSLSGGGEIIPNRKKSSTKPSWTQVLAVLIVLAALATAITLDLRGEQLALVLTATLTVAGGLASKR